MINNRQGKALPTVLAFSIIAQLLGGFMLSQVVANRHLVDYEEVHMYSNYITEAGLNWTLNTIYENPEIADVANSSNYTLDDIIYPLASTYIGTFVIELLPLDEEKVQITIRSKMNTPTINFDINNVLVAIVEKDTAQILSKKWLEL